MKLLLFFLFFLPTFLFSKYNIYITSLTKTAPYEYSITFNNLFTIKEVKIKKTTIGKKEFFNLELPFYVSYSNNKYPQIILLSREINDRIIKSILDFKTEKDLNYFKEVNFKIEKYNFYNQKNSTLKVFASVIFDDIIEVECRIFESKRGMWVSWPQRKDFNTSKWISQFEFNNKEFKDKVENELLYLYKVYKIEKNEP